MMSPDNDVQVKLHSYIFFHMLSDMLNDGVPITNALFLAGEVVQINSNHLAMHSVLPSYVFIGLHPTTERFIRFAFSEEEVPDLAQHVSYMINDLGCVDPIAVFAVSKCLGSYASLEARESGWIEHEPSAED